MKVCFTEILGSHEATLLCGIKQGEEKHPLLSAEVLKTLKEKAAFNGALYSSISLVLHAADKAPCHVLLMGLGAGAEASSRWFRRLGAALADAAQAFPAVALAPEMLVASQTEEKYFLDLLTSYVARQYSFDKYKAKKSKFEQTLTVTGSKALVLEKDWAKRANVAAATHRVKDIVSEPPNEIYPESVAARACALKEIGLSVEVLDEQAMKVLNMGAILGVGQGSVRPPRLVLLQWQGAPDKSAAPVVLVGKGITFDSGGLSLKSRQNMRGMKHDMAGAAVVLETLHAAAENKLPINVVGLLALAENMPAGNALRPDDIILTASGQYVEIVSTDAEGRLVLCDALWYAEQRFKPACMVDIATLTGAMPTSLGWQKAGVFSNNQDLVEKLLAAGEDSDENLWRMPMDGDYDVLIEPNDADMENATFGQMARSTFAAKYLERFVGNTPWAHIDIAGTAWSDKNTRQARKGATAFGMQLLYSFLEKQSHGA